MATSPSHDIKAPQVHLSHIIHFQPSSEVAAAIWDCPMNVLTYLLCHPEERLSLLIEAKRQSPHQPQHFKIYHPLLKSLLGIRTDDEDLDLVNELLIVASEQSRHCKQIHKACYPLPYPVIHPSSTVHIPQTLVSKHSSVFLNLCLLPYLALPLPSQARSRKDT
jgi:hypothetical protein